MQTHKTVSRNRNSSEDVLWKNVKAETKNMNILERIPE